MTDQTPIDPRRAQIFELLRDPETAQIEERAPLLQPTYVSENDAEAFIRRAMASFRELPNTQPAEAEAQPKAAQASQPMLNARMTPRTG